MPAVVGYNKNTRKNVKINKKSSGRRGSAKMMRVSNVKMKKR